MKLLKYIIDWGKFRRSEHDSVSDLLLENQTLRRDAEQPISLIRLERGAVVESVKCGVWDERTPFNITLETSTIYPEIK